jgi:hypothetical protein
MTYCVPPATIVTAPRLLGGPARIVPAWLMMLSAFRPMAVATAVLVVWIRPGASWVMPWPIAVPLAVSEMLVATVPVPVVWIVPAFWMIDVPAVRPTLPSAASIRPPVWVMDVPAVRVVPPVPAALVPVWSMAALAP